MISIFEFCFEGKCALLWYHLHRSPADRGRYPYRLSFPFSASIGCARPRCRPWRFRQRVRVGPRARLPRLPALCPSEEVTSGTTGRPSRGGNLPGGYRCPRRPSQTWPGPDALGNDSGQTLSETLLLPPSVPSGKTRTTPLSQRWVLIDDTNGLSVYDRTRIRDQERAYSHGR